MAFFLRTFLQIIIPSKGKQKQGHIKHSILFKMDYSNHFKNLVPSQNSSRKCFKFETGISNFDPFQIGMF